MNAQWTKGSWTLGIPAALAFAVAVLSARSPTAGSAPGEAASFGTPAPVAPTPTPVAMMAEPTPDPPTPIGGPTPGYLVTLPPPSHDIPEPNPSCPPEQGVCLVESTAEFSMERCIARAEERGPTLWELVPAGPDRRRPKLNTTQCWYEPRTWVVYQGAKVWSNYYHATDPAIAEGARRDAEAYFRVVSMLDGIPDSATLASVFYDTGEHSPYRRALAGVRRARSDLAAAGAYVRVAVLEIQWEGEAQFTWDGSEVRQRYTLPRTGVEYQLVDAAGDVLERQTAEIPFWGEVSLRYNTATGHWQILDGRDGPFDEY